MIYTPLDNEKSHQECRGSDCCPELGRIGGTEAVVSTEFPENREVLEVFGRCLAC